MKIESEPNRRQSEPARLRAKKKPKVLHELKPRDENDQSIFFNLKDLVVGVERNFPIVYNLEPVSPEESSYKNLLDSSDSKETVNSKSRKNSNYVSNSKLSMTSHDFKQLKISSQNPSKRVSSCYIIQLYFIYLILCVIVMSCSFGFYYTIVSNKLKMEHLEKRLSEKFSKQMSMMMFISKKDSKETTDDDYSQYEDTDKQKDDEQNIKLLKSNVDYFSAKKSSRLFEPLYYNVDKDYYVIPKDDEEVKEFITESIANGTTESDFLPNSTTVSLIKDETKVLNDTNLIENLKNNRHRKRLENSSIKLEQCSIKFINPQQTSLIFMGIFHCNWMNEIGSFNNNYYITKGFKGFSVTMCQNLDELKSYRCYRHLPLEYSYYGTGHTIYKGYMFYNQEGTGDLVVHGLNGKETTKIKSPNDSLCCQSGQDMYSMKHSGFYDFETDENGLWLIYRDFSKESYIISKIDDSNLNELKVIKKWSVNVTRVANMFIACGQLYALKETSKNPAVIHKICDLTNDVDCTNSYENDTFNISISSRQMTSLSYNPDKKMLYGVDGGSFVYYKIQI